MRPYALLIAAVPLVLSDPAPAPAPQPNLLTGLKTGVITAVANLGSVLDAIPAIITDLKDLSDAVNEVTQAIENGTIHGTDVPAAVSLLYAAVKPTQTITSISQATSLVAAQFGLQAGQAPTSQTSRSLLTNVLGLVLNGFTSTDLTAVLNGVNPDTNGFNNANPSISGIYPKATAADVTYSVPEPTLRAAIYIPSNVVRGSKKQVVIMSPGTGTTGGINFESNIGKLLTADAAGNDNWLPVYLNVPEHLLNDAQVNAEFVAFAINYMYAYTNSDKENAIITWSQGSVDTQWALKYWPSTRSKIQDHIAISPDYHGSTVIPYLLCPGFALGNAIACNPSMIQQRYDSNFIKKLRSNGGANSYVDVTTVYSLTDLIVQPQEGTAASGFISPGINGTNTSNTYLQDACRGQPAGGVYTHEGVLYNPVSYALIKDALNNPGPGQFSRVSSSCADVVTPGLSLSDVIEAEALIPLVLYNIFAYTPKALFEPAIMSYATY